MEQKSSASPRPKIVTVCGSTRFKEECLQVISDLERGGYAVFSVGSFPHSEGERIDPGLKATLDQLHLSKIDISDGIYVVNVGGYIGKSTQAEIEYARSKGKTIAYLEGSDGYIRPEVTRFSTHMERILRNNDHKGGWGDRQGLDIPDYLRLLKLEVTELEDALARWSWAEIADEVIDVTNFCLMIFDIANKERIAHD